MTQPPNDRFDQIQAALDRQVQVNADLLTRLEILSNTVQSLQASVGDLRISVADLRATAEALVTNSEVHQQNFEVIAQELRSSRADIAQIQEGQRTTNATLDRMGAILEFLVQERGGSN
jgi:chromosome segregation ATPase